MKKIFISYTTLDKEINVNLLKRIKKKVSNVGETFIHLLDNNLKESQEAVIKELKSSNILILLDTDRVNESKWVQIEINYANEMGICILKIKPEGLLALSDIELERIIDRMYEIR